ncbi:MAG: twin-arginine translocase subunit TatC [Planctomycetota bacterium]|nr:twin-arginine translocase subunit TatC [Planctomycetota bacterium]
MRKPLQKILHPAEKRLTFGDHLEDLRRSLIRSLFAVAILCVLCLIYQDRLMAIVREPYDRMARNAEKARAESEDGFETLEVLHEQIKAADEKWEDLAALMDGADESVSPLLVDAIRHLKGSIDRVREPVLKLRGDARKIQSIKPTAVFVAYIKVSLIAAIFIASPIILYELWMFIGAGLYPSERRYVIRFLPVSILLFFLGILFGYKVLVPVGLSYLATYAGPDVINAFTLDNYLSLSLTLTLLLGVVFELPLLMVFFSRIGILGPADYARYRRYSLLGSVVIAALLTPPDPATQILLAGPLIILYELGILFSRVLGRPSEE